MLWGFGHNQAGLLQISRASGLTQAGKGNKDCVVSWPGSCGGNRRPHASQRTG